MQDSKPSLPGERRESFFLCRLGTLAAEVIHIISQASTTEHRHYYPVESV